MRVGKGAFLAVVALCSLGEAEAKAARCLTTDEGNYPCQFQSTSRDGSFQISASGKPTYILNIVEPGVAVGFVNLGARNVALPGRYLRSRADPACWENTATLARICAW